jgi:DNA polymerase/3'-5' exonuclease PolX
MDYLEARALAEKVCHQLVPYCEKIKIAGSIRRKKSQVSDIDIVCIPKTKPVKDLFGMISHHERDPGFINVVNQWDKLKGDATGKYMQRMVEGHKLEIACATPDNWGNILLIRTGNSDFSHLIMKIVNSRGFTQKDGFLYRNERMIHVPEEWVYFKTLGIPYVEPELRNADAFKKI